jgi:hypothetical protein
LKGFGSALFIGLFWGLIPLSAIYYSLRLRKKLPKE